MQILITLIDLQSMCNRSMLRLLQTSLVNAIISLNQAFDFTNMQQGNFELSRGFVEFDDE